MEPRKIFGKAQGQQGNQSDQMVGTDLLPFALWLIVTNLCEYMNNLVRIPKEKLGWSSIFHWFAVVSELASTLGARLWATFKCIGEYLSRFPPLRIPARVIYG